MMCLKQWKIISLKVRVMFEFLSFNKHQLLGPEANSLNLPETSGCMCAKMNLNKLSMKSKIRNWVTDVANYSLGCKLMMVLLLFITFCVFQAENAFGQQTIIMCNLKNSH